MKVKIGIWMWCMICCYSVSAQTATLYGTVTDGENGEPILFGNVALYQDGVLVTGVETDFDGNYAVRDLEAGVYDVEASYVGYTTQRITDVEILKNENNELNIDLGIGMMLGGDDILYCPYLIPLVDQSDNTQGQIITSSQLRNRGRAY